MNTWIFLELASTSESLVQLFREQERVRGGLVALSDQSRQPYRELIQRFVREGKFDLASRTAQRLDVAGQLDIFGDIAEQFIQEGAIGIVESMAAGIALDKVRSTLIQRVLIHHLEAGQGSPSIHFIHRRLRDKQEKLNWFIWAADQVRDAGDPAAYENAVAVEAQLLRTAWSNAKGWLSANCDALDTIQRAIIARIANRVEMYDVFDDLLKDSPAPGVFDYAIDLITASVRNNQRTAQDKHEISVPSPSAAGPTKERSALADLHTALRTEILEQQHGHGVEFVLVRLQDGRDKIRYSLHARPNSYSTSGAQATDLLGLIGFERSACSFVSGGECYVKAIEGNFELTAFTEAFPEALGSLQAAERHLERCRYFLELPEGWKFFHGLPSEPRRRPRPTVAGDGHTAQIIEPKKVAEDGQFRYAFTWLNWSDHVKGWTTHVRPKHPPLSSEVEQAFNHIGLQTFAECPEFEFEACHWRFLPWGMRGNSMFDGNNEVAHGWFGAHSEHFSPGIECLLYANVTVEPFDMRLLPKPIALPPCSTPAGDSVQSQVIDVAQPSTYEFDVAISFAGTERQYAQRLAAITREAGYQVFYDRYYQEQLWGKDLPVFFDEIYRKKARFCVIVASNEYINRMWTNHERQSAVARALEERGNEYILPIQVDRVESPGVSPTIGYISLDEMSIEEIGKALIKKLSLD